jgi:hypothetical protein
LSHDEGSHLSLFEGQCDLLAASLPIWISQPPQDEGPFRQIHRRNGSSIIEGRYLEIATEFVIGIFLGKTDVLEKNIK